MRLSRATSGLHRRRKCKGEGGRTGAEHGGDVSAPPGRHPARPSRGQREPQRERERRDAPPERRVTITTPHSGRVRAGRDATLAEAPCERPAANVSPACCGGPGAGQAWGGGSLRACAPFLSSRASWKQWPRRLSPAVQTQPPPAERPKLRRGEAPLCCHSLPAPRPAGPPGKQRLEQDWTRRRVARSLLALAPGSLAGRGLSS